MHNHIKSESILEHQPTKSLAVENFSGFGRS